MRAVDLSQVRTLPLAKRPNKVALEKFSKAPAAGRSFREFFDSLPAILAGDDLRRVVEAIVAARSDGRPVVLAIGAHVIKCGLSPVIIDLMRRGIVTALALNGSGAIHDFEVALIGETSEDVAAGLKDGTFGMVRETGELMNEAINQVKRSPDKGFGRLLGERLIAMDAPNQDLSLLANACRLGVPATVHVAIGTDIIHMHPSADGAALGQATFNDFKLLAGVVSELSRGVYLNVGSAVVLPEVFLKAVTVAQNLGAGLHDFVTVNMDMTAHYRPSENVVRRPSLVGRAGYTLLGRHEIMLPLLAHAVIEALGKADPSTSASKIVPLPKLVDLRHEWRRQNRRVVWTNGCFDLLHVGHLRSLQMAKQLGDILVVGVNSDRSVRELKGTERPLLPEEERAEMIAALECVDFVTVFDELTPVGPLAQLMPDVHCKGADYKPPHGKPIPEANVVAGYGGHIEFIDLKPGASTTAILERIRAL